MIYKWLNITLNKYSDKLTIKLLVEESYYPSHANQDKIC